MISSFDKVTCVNVHFGRQMKNQLVFCAEGLRYEMAGVKGAQSYM